ncbi:MAG: 6-phosphogluconolactonase [Actinomycetota bacterium]|nr:6-phosphogluconolactonase [Actinomycetota bacterium]
MTPGIEVFPVDSYPGRAAARIASSLPATGSVVLTGGSTAEKIYPVLAEIGAAWGDLTILFSDERCVPPDDERSNFRMASELLLDEVDPRHVHRMRGEDDPADAARRYDGEISPLVGAGLDLVLLGMGADAHIGALYPGSPSLQESELLCAAVQRPDGLGGLTLTPAALGSARATLLLVTGGSKAETVRRVLEGDEAIASCPARLVADLPEVTFLLDEDSARLL